MYAYKVASKNMYDSVISCLGVILNISFLAECHLLRQIQSFY